MTTATTPDAATSPAAPPTLAQAFDSKPNPARLRLFEATRQAYDGMRMALKAGRALSLLVGYEGVGKSSLMQRLGEELGGREALSIYLPSSHMALDDVLRACCEGMNVQGQDDSRNARLIAIARYAGEVNRRAIMFFVDNAHTYSNAALLDFAALSAFDTGTPVVYQVVLAGPPSLEEYLELNLQQVRGRVSAIVRMGPLAAEDVETYIRFRLEQAGGEGGDAFNADLVGRIARKSYGVPRLINELCAYALTHPMEDVLAHLEPDPPPPEVIEEDAAPAAETAAPAVDETTAPDGESTIAPATPIPEEKPAAPVAEISLPASAADESTIAPAAATASTTTTSTPPAGAIPPPVAPAHATPSAIAPDAAADAGPPPGEKTPPPSEASDARAATAAPSDDTFTPVEQPATMLIDDVPVLETPPPALAIESGEIARGEMPADPTPLTSAPVMPTLEVGASAEAETTAPKRRFSFRTTESAARPQTYDEWRRSIEAERRRERGASGDISSRFEYEPMEVIKPSAPRVLVPAAANPAESTDTPPHSALDDAQGGAVPWVAAVETALLRAAERAGGNGGGGAAQSGHKAEQSADGKSTKATRSEPTLKSGGGDSRPDDKTKPAADAPPAKKKRRFGFFG